jgi:probable F420-dependent oxidoreductase
MKIGFSIPNNQGIEDPNDLVMLATAAERSGFSSVWVHEHLFHTSYVEKRLGTRPYHDALTVLTAIACATTTVRLGTSVLVLPWHDPARLGKMIATLDHLSGGRVDMGIGVATARDEFENLGVDFGTRGKRTDEILGALKALWTQDRPHFSGEFYHSKGMIFSPRPKQTPHPPILIGGSSMAALRRVARFGDGWHTLRQTPRQFAEGRQKINALMEEANRDPSTLDLSISVSMKFNGAKPEIPVEDRLSLTGTDDDILDTLRAFQAAGVDEIIVAVNSAELPLNKEGMAHIMLRIWPRL